MTTRDRLAALTRLLQSTAAVPGQRLPAGRCACHEPTVKWCGRHGQPLSLEALLRGGNVPSGA
jgi:hypothetical protein